MRLPVAMALMPEDTGASRSRRLPCSMQAEAEESLEASLSTSASSGTSTRPEADIPAARDIVQLAIGEEDRAVVAEGVVDAVVAGALQVVSESRFQPGGLRLRRAGTPIASPTFGATEDLEGTPIASPTFGANEDLEAPISSPAFGGQSASKDLPLVLPTFGTSEVSEAKGVRDGRAVHHLTLSPGTQLDYWSDSYQRWVAAVVSHRDAETGAVSLDVKPGFEIEVAEQHERLRPRTKPNQAQFEWARALLREDGGRLEAMAIFRRHARQQERSCRGGAESAPSRQVLTLEDLPALSSELDAALGVSFSLPALQHELHARDGHTLTAEGFAQVFSTLLWRVERECSQVLATKPRRREEDPHEVYNFEQTLGSGVYGPVRFAKSGVTGMTHAVKVLRRNGLTPGSLDEKERLDHELGHLRRLDHPNIVKLYDHFENDEGIFLVMDYCSGGQLRSMITEGKSSGRKLPDVFVADVTRQVLSAMAHMHSRCVVHLDLSATNIMLMPSREAMMPTRNTGWCPQYTPAQVGPPEHVLREVQERPHVMVIDFGLAQVLRPGTTCYNAPVSFEAALAPEVWRGELTSKADVFSCGALLFEMLSLMQPFACPREYVLAVNYWNQKPKPAWEKVKHSPRDAVELCRKMLQLSRHQRPEAQECYHQSHFLQESDPTCGSALQGAQLAPRLLQRLADVPSRSWLHKSVAFSIACGWPANQLNTVKRVFHALDTQGIGRLDKEQVACVLELVGVQGPLARQTADAMDLSREGKVTWTEFVAACTDLADPRYDEQLRRIFEAADSDGDDLLSQDDIASMLASDHFCADVARDVFVEMTGRDEPGARVDWPTFRRHLQRRPREPEGVLASECMGIDVAGVVQGRLVDLAERASGLLEQARAKLWSVEDPDTGELQEEKLQQLAAMGFGDRERCAAALRRHRGDMRHALEDLVAIPPSAHASNKDRRHSDWWLMRMF